MFMFIKGKNFLHSTKGKLGVRGIKDNHFIWLEKGCKHNDDPLTTAATALKPFLFAAKSGLCSFF